MDKKRQCEIALLIFKRDLRARGVFASDFQDGNVEKDAEEIGVSAKEFSKFMEVTMRELIKEMFLKPRKSGKKKKPSSSK